MKTEIEGCEEVRELMERFILTKEKIRQYGQGHLLTFYEDLEENEKKELVEQINTIDFEEIEKAFSELSVSSVERNRELSSIDYESVVDFTNSTREQYTEKGLKLLKENKVAVVLLAGGQGTRLGYDGPKGTVSINIFTLCLAG